MKVEFTGHAMKRMYERNVSPKEVEHLISKGMKWFVKSEGTLGRWHAKMGNAEVVFEKNGDITVITVYWVE